MHADSKVSLFTGLFSFYLHALGTMRVVRFWLFDKLSNMLRQAFKSASRDISRTVNIIQWEYYAAINCSQANIDWLTFWRYFVGDCVCFVLLRNHCVGRSSLPNTPQFREIYIHYIQLSVFESTIQLILATTKRKKVPLLRVLKK